MDLSGKVTVLIDDCADMDERDIKKVLYDAYFDLQKPIEKTYDFAKFQIEYRGYIDESRYPLSPIVLD